ncbi:HNH endonuclease [Cellvibrio sp. ARAG 10.3]|uniref:HNH endonuclease n=1 Tax=Cellvibrio sp. ARAG 10.3 TaxID=3451358 RepID=UPI003F461A32
MPLINNVIEFNKEQQAIIKTPLGNWDLTPDAWGCDELLQIRRAIREFYSKEQGGTCAYCQQNISLQSTPNAQIEHIIAKSIKSKFMFEPKNLCIICADCNEIKRDKEVTNQEELVCKNEPKIYPRSSSAFKIVHPHFDDWHEHIVMIGGIYLDWTDKGEFTIRCCRLNRRFREYGYKQEMVDDKDYMELMSTYMKTDSPQLKAKILETIVRKSIWGKE